MCQLSDNFPIKEIIQQQITKEDAVILFDIKEDNFFQVTLCTYKIDEEKKCCASVTTRNMNERGEYQCTNTTHNFKTHAYNILFICTFFHLKVASFIIPLWYSSFAFHQIKEPCITSFVRQSC